MNNQAKERLEEIETEVDKLIAGYIKKADTGSKYFNRFDFSQITEADLPEDLELLKAVELRIQRHWMALKFEELSSTTDASRMPGGTAHHHIDTLKCPLCEETFSGSFTTDCLGRTSPALISCMRCSHPWVFNPLLDSVIKKRIEMAKK